MKFQTFRRPYSLAILLGSALAFARCSHETLAGSSVTTGNPTEIQVSFTGENGPTALTGRVDIYGATQVPIPGFQPEPLASIEVAGKQDVLLDADDIKGIADSLWPVGSLEGDSLARFNLVFTGEGQGAILRDLTLRRKAGEFVVEVVSTLARTSEESAADEDQIARLEVGLTALTEYRAFIDPENLLPTRLNYLFLKGTGFAAREEGGHFRFEGLPIGDHFVSYLSVPDTGKGETGIDDSAWVYNLDRPISSGATDTLSLTGVDFQLTLPDIFRTAP